MAGPLDGIDLGPPSPNAKKPAPAAPPSGTDATGPLSGIDLSAPSSSTTTAPADTGWTLAHNPILSVRGPWDAPANQPLEQTAAWNKPSDVSWSDYAKAHFQPVTDIAHETANPFGLGDDVIAAGKSLVGGGSYADNVAAERAQTAAREARMPTQNRLAANVLSYEPVAALGVGTKLADLWGGSRLARAGGAATENAAANVAGTAGHGDYNVGDLIKSGVIGAVTGGVTGGVSPSPKVGATPTTSDLEDVAKQQYAPLSNTRYPTPAVERVVNNVNVPQGLQSKMSQNLSDQIDRIKGIVAQGGKTTANDIADFRASILGAARTPADSVIAQQYVSALENGVGPQMTATIGAANKASNVAKTSGEIDDWITQAQRSPGKVPDAVNKAITDDPQFYQTHPDLMPMLQDVANSKPGIWSKIGEKAIATAGGAAIEGISNYLTGSNPLSGALTGGATGLLLGHAVGKQRSTDLANKLAAVRHLNATGMKLPPSAFGFGPLSKLAGYGQELAPAVPAIGASGWFANQPQ